MCDLVLARGGRNRAEVRISRLVIQTNRRGFPFVRFNLQHLKRRKNMRRIVYGMIALVVIARLAVAGPMTALDEYVAKPDAFYKWNLVKTIPGHSSTTYILDLTSQGWPKATNKKVWQHYVQVIVPAATTSHTAFLLIEGGSTATSPPSECRRNCVGGGRRKELHQR